MGAFATIRMPVDLTRRHNASEAAISIVAAFPGTRAVELDAGAETIAFELHFPGNLSGLVRRLHDGLIPVGTAATVSLPVRSLADRPAPQEVAARVIEGAEVWDVAFERGRFVEAAALEGDRLDARIVPHSNAMHQIYDALMSLGLVAANPQLAVARGS